MYQLSLLDNWCHTKLIEAVLKNGYPNGNLRMERSGTLEGIYLISKSRATASPNLSTPARRRASGGQPGTKAHRRARKNRAQIAGLGHTRPAVPLRAKRGGPGGLAVASVGDSQPLSRVVRFEYLISDRSAATSIKLKNTK